MARVATTKKPAAKKPAAKKPAAKKPAAKKPAAKKPAAKKPAAKKPAATTKKPAAKKPAATTKKPAAKKPAAKKPAAKKPAAKKPAAKKPSLGEPTTSRAFEPLVLMSPSKYSPHWSLLLADSDSPIALFEEEGHSGNGYSWDSVARVALAGTPEHLDAIDYNSEGGTFVAISKDEGPLRVLGAALQRLLSNGEELRKTIRAVPEDDWDD